MATTKPFLVRFRAPAHWHTSRDHDCRPYATLAGALRGIAQGLNPTPPGRGMHGADLYSVGAGGRETHLGHAAWGDGVYWLDLTDDGAAMGLEYDAEVAQ